MGVAGWGVLGVLLGMGLSVAAWTIDMELESWSVACARV